MTTKPARVLVVDDDETVAEVLTRYLERDGFEVETATDGSVALDRAVSSPPDLVILDLMLPGLDGIEVCRRLRASIPVPIIMLTARGEEADRVLGLEIGADDYVAKPFSPRELVARVKSVLRRAQGLLPAMGPDTPRKLGAGDIELDVVAHQVRVRGEIVALTVREFELMLFFLLHPNEVFRRQALLERVWGYSFGDTSTVTVHVRRLREKVEADPANPTHIETVWGVGYRFRP